MRKAYIAILSVLAFGFLMSLTSCKKSENSGNIMFWTNNYTQSISVQLRGATKYITSYYYSGTPSCGDNGCATFYDVPAGSYTYYASNDYFYWTGSVSVSKNQCSTMRLYVGKAEKISEPTETDAPMLEAAEYQSYSE